MKKKIVSVMLTAAMAAVQQLILQQRRPLRQLMRPQRTQKQLMRLQKMQKQLRIPRQQKMQQK